LVLESAAHYRLVWQLDDLAQLPPNLLRGIVVVKGERLAPWQQILRRITGL
jgi:hypothetical protein